MQSFFGEGSNFEPPWPIWEDSAINTMKWTGDPRVKKNWVFEDPVDQGAMPPSISVSYWRRPDFNQYETEWTVAAEESPIDLIKHNSHLFKYKIMSWIISSIQCLEEIGRKQPFEIEFQNSSFYYNGGPNWKPWNHVYALTKAGKGSTHSPRLNKSGLYIVRLFYMGAWRRIAVDDQLPYNENGELLLPCTKNKCNLWPQILTKGILRIASLSWTSLDDLVDFSIITCLTGWPRFVLDCRSISVHEAWRVIQMFLISKEQNEEENKPFCLTTPSQTCLNDNFQFHCKDSPKMRTIFATLSKTENELPDLLSVKDQFVWIPEVKIDLENDVKNLPTWKKLRWLDWVRQKGSKRTLGIMKRIVKMHSPFRKRNVPNPYTDNILSSLTAKIVSGEVTTGNMKLLLYNEMKNEGGEVEDENNDSFLSLRFSFMFPFIRELEVYFKSKNFLYIQDITDLDKFINEKIEERKTVKVSLETKKTSKSNAQQPKLQPQLHGNYKMQCVYLYSDSQYCKNFFISLSICKNSSHVSEDGYLAFEEFNWKSRIMGTILFSLWTCSTKTHFFQLGNGIQVCRIWYFMPSEYYVSIRGNTPFEILNEEKLHFKLSEYSESFIAYGVKISEAFSQMRLGTLRTPDHYALINYFKQSLYPPVFNTLTESYKATLIKDFNEVFDECISQLVFEHLESMSSAAACIEALKLLFNNDQLGNSVIEQFSNTEKKELELCRLAVIEHIRTFYKDKILEKLKEFKINHKIALDEERKTSIYPAEVVQPNLSSQRDPEPLFNAEDIALLDDPLFNIELLRKILYMKKEYIHLYPFRNEHDLKLNFHEYSGSTTVTPLHKWFLITRLLVNVHSQTDVPCVIIVSTSYTKSTLAVFEIDSCKQVLCAFDVNSVYYLSRRKAGYAILVYGYPTQDIIKEEFTVFWKIKVIGVDRGNILHYCHQTPVLCKQPLSDPHSIHVQSITGFYFPNIENIIGRFQIKSKGSPVVTLYISLSRENVKMRVTIRGREKDICVAEGRGVVLIPVSLLDKNVAVKSAYDPDMCIFRGEIQLLSLWKLNKDETIFEQNLRTTPQKDILSFEDFKDFSLDELEQEEEETLEEEEYIKNHEESESSGSSKLIKKKKRKYGLTENFLVESEEESDDISVLSEKHLPFGLLSYSAHWRISMILDDIDAEDTVLQHDDQAGKAYEMFTKSWEENDPGRAERAEIIRNEFLMIGKNEFMKMQLNPEEVTLSDISGDSIFSEKEKELISTSSHSFKKRGHNDYSSKRGKSNKGGRQKTGSLKTDGKTSKNDKIISKAIVDLKSDCSGYKTKKLQNSKERNTRMDGLLRNYEKKSQRFSDEDRYDQNKEELRAGRPSMSTKPLASMLNKTVKTFRCPPCQSSYTSCSVMSLSSDSSSEEKESSSISDLEFPVHKKYPKFPMIQPSVSLLANIPSQEHILPVASLFRLYCSKLKERTVIEDKSAPKDKSITKALIQLYSKPSENTVPSHFSSDIFDLDITPNMPYESLTVKDLKAICEETDDLKSFLDEYIQPTLWFISKQTFPKDLLDPPPEFLTQVELGRAMNETLLKLKKEKDDLISDHQIEMQSELLIKESVEYGRKKRSAPKRPTNKI